MVLLFQNCSNILGNGAKSEDSSAPPTNESTTDNSISGDESLFVTDFSKLELRNTATKSMVTDGKLKLNTNYLVSFAAKSIAPSSTLNILVSANSTAACSIQRVADAKALFSGSCTSPGKYVVKLTLNQSNREEISSVLEFQVLDESKDSGDPIDPIAEPTIKYFPLTNYEINEFGFVVSKVISESDSRLLPNVDVELAVVNYRNGSYQVKNILVSPKSKATCSVAAKKVNYLDSLRKFNLNCTTFGELILEFEVFQSELVRYEYKISVEDPKDIWNSLFLPRIGYNGFHFYGQKFVSSANFNIESTYPILTTYMNYYGPNFELGLYAPSSEASTKASIEIVETIDKADSAGTVRCEIKNVIPNLKPNGVSILFCENLGSVTLRLKYQLLKTTVSRDIKYELY